VTPALAAVAAVALAGAWAAQFARWLRVLQREHYEPASLRRFLERWTSPPVPRVSKVSRSGRPITPSHVALLALVVALVAHFTWLLVVATVLYGLFCPWGLSIKGRTAPLQWTRRLRTVASVATAVSLLIVGLALLAGGPWIGAAIVVWGAPMVLSLSARILEPIERRNAQVFVDQAAKRLAQVHPTVVGITGSYGKTSTKNHLADLLRPDGGVVATPKSFNNKAGLSRAINEGLSDGTRVFIAEMGTYGPGEIAALCSWCPPSLSVVTAIGPVHLERMKSLDVIEKAKFEITERAATVILNVDDPRLATWPSRLAPRRVRTASARSAADVQVRVDDDRWTIVLDGRVVTSIEPRPSVQPTNLACAIAAALELGLDEATVVARLSLVGAVANRAVVTTAPSGVVVIDDTFNANPASARASLALLRSLPVTGRRVVVTPGLIELGPEQYRENVALAAAIHHQGASLVVVNRTNAKALLEGVEGTAHRVNVRDDAVAWVRATLAVGDAVLYLNDLPDHYP